MKKTINSILLLLLIQSVFPTNTAFKFFKKNNKKILSAGAALAITGAGYHLASLKKEYII